MSVICAEALGFAYRERWVLQDIQLQVAEGEIYGLVGADGAGKTTQGFPIHSLQPVAPELEDVFVAVLEEVQQAGAP